MALQQGQKQIALRLLIVTATAPEIAPLVAQLRPSPTANPRLATATYRGHTVDVLTTGVGMVATAAWCARAIGATRYDLAINFGVCGSFDSSLAPGQVVHVTSDRIAELGAEDHERFLTIQELQLLGDNEFPFDGGVLVNRTPPVNPVIRGLRSVSAITVNTVHGNEQSIARTVERFRPQVESMEGAAFMYACLIHDVPFAQIRAVSNVVEKRNRAAWKLPEAIRSLGEVALRILDTV